MNPIPFKFEVGPLYKSLAFDAFATLEALEQKPANKWFAEQMHSVARQFTPPNQEKVCAVKAHNFNQGALAAFEAFNDTSVNHEARRRTTAKVVEKVLLLATRPNQQPDAFYRDLTHTAREGFAAHQELITGGVLIVAHLVERCGDVSLAEAGRVGFGFAGQLLGAACRSFMEHPTAAIDRECAEAMANFDQSLAQFRADIDTPPPLG